MKYEVAVFNVENVLTAVKEVSADDHVTNPSRRQMALSLNHDVHTMLGRYRANDDYSSLEPIYDKCPRSIEMELIGYAFARWFVVEEELLDTFSLLLRGARPEALRAAFYAIRTFEAKLNVVDAIIETTHPDIHPAWKKLKDNLRNKSKQRNEIAHLGRMFSDGKYVLFHQKHTKFKEYETNIEHICENFGKAAALIRDFRTHLTMSVTTPLG